MSIVLAPAAPRRRSLALLVAVALGLPLAMSAGTALTRPMGGSARAADLPSGRLDPGLPVGDPAPVAVVVQLSAGAAERVAAAVTAAGGTVGRALPMVDGFAARIPGTALTRIAGLPGVRAITADRPVQFQAVDYAAGNVASAFPKTSGATSAWRSGRIGTGVGVAVIDTGVSPMNDFAGRLVHGPDLSGEGRVVDSFGHGTVMAGVIGGSGADSEHNSAGAYTGVAPGATLVGVKVAGRNGATDVSTVLEAMHWVSAYREQFNIRVLNLSWGTDSTADPAVDPLNYAVERLWREGIVVVVAAGNGGPKQGTITKPADDPLVLTVGAYDDKATLATSDDTVPGWSAQGPATGGGAKPDLVAPGRTLVSTRSYGSAVEQDNPQAHVAPTYIKGSGTSQAAAVVSGLAALLLDARPSLTPDQVKALLTRTASPISGVAATRQGAGRVRLADAMSADPGPANWQSFRGSGLGAIDASRGSMRVARDCGDDGTMDTISGEIIGNCEAWNGATWTGATWTGATWTGATWTGATWTGATWTGGHWSGATWTGATWTGGEWTGGAWSGATWTGATWTGATWTGATWTGATWTGATWTGATWTGATWTGATWTGATWTGATWTSASYGSGRDSSSQTAFWGEGPRFWQALAGERSERPPAALVAKAVEKYGLPLTVDSSLLLRFSDRIDAARYDEQVVDVFRDLLVAYAAATK